MYELLRSHGSQVMRHKLKCELLRNCLQGSGSAVADLEKHDLMCAESDTWSGEQHSDMALQLDALQRRL